MNDIAIRVENLSKLYHLGRAQQRHDTLRDALIGALPRIPRISRKGNANVGFVQMERKTLKSAQKVNFSRTATPAERPTFG